ncbi:MAG: YdeI/OmpD-associated family protein [Caldilineaceae bacterium]
MKLLRTILLDRGLTEEVKWKVPCYTFQNSNILIMSAFKGYCALSFFKGALLKDAHGVLDKPGENSQAARLIRFTSVHEIVAMESILKAYIDEAIAVEKAGLAVEFNQNPEPLPAELQTKLDEIPALKAAFEALTPGRQRGYILYFAAPKQSKTRTARVEKCMQQILDGKGLNER